MFQSEIRFPVVVSLDYDPAADDQIPIWRAPLAGYIKSAYATVVNDVGASTANYFSVHLRNGGSAGTAATVISSTVGGTAGWTGLTPNAFTIATSAFSAGDVLCLYYDETGTGTFGQLAVQLDVVYK